MVAIGDVFATPLGLAGLAAAIPIIILYLIKPDPEQLQLPTFRFLVQEEGRESTNPVLKRLRRNLLLLVQLLVVIALAASLASPYTLVTETQVTEETVIVVDASASMATETGDGTRFERAIAAAREAIAGSTSIVAATSDPSIVRRRVPPSAARTALGEIERTDGSAALGTAITRATAIADEEARIVVVSDFAGESWTQAVQTARAQGYRVALQQMAGGGGANVGITDVAFPEGSVRVAVTNFGDETAVRDVRVGDASERLSIDPGSVATATLPLPAGGARVRLEPGDDFPIDDVAYVGSPADARADVLLVTSDRNRFLTTALEVNDAVTLQVVNPPAPEASPGEYDVILFSNVDGGDLLGGTVRAAGRAVDRGSGVAILAQTSLADIDYRGLLPITPTGTARNPTVSVTDHELTAGIRFPPPEQYVTGDLRAGRALVSADDGPLVALADKGRGRVLYYGYIERSADGSAFAFNYQYPVFWKRAIQHLADREPPSQLTRRTGERLTVANDTTVETPGGTVAGPVVSLDRVGWYATDDRRYGASLLDPRESDVAATPLDATEAPVAPGSEARLVPRSLTHWAALIALLVALLELGVLRRRGDL